MNGPHVLREAGSEFFSSRRLAAKNSNFVGQLEAESRWQLFFVSGIFFQVQKNSNKELRKKLFDFSCVAIFFNESSKLEC